MKTVRDNCFALGCLVALALSHGNSDLYAQSTDTNTNTDNYGYWINAGLGVSSFGVSPGLSLSYQTGRSLVSIRYVYNAEFNILGPSPRESVWDFGGLYGICTKGSHFFAAASGGISFVGGARRGKYIGSSGLFSSKYEENDFFTFGIPVEGQLVWTPFSFLGIGIYGFANLNLEKSFLGALLSLQVGKLR